MLTQVRIAVVGQGTGQVIQAKGDPLLHVDYTPPKVSQTSQGTWCFMLQVNLTAPAGLLYLLNVLAACT